MSRVEVGMSRGVLTPPPDMGYKVDTVGKQVVRIILECFFVFDMFSSAMRTVGVFHCGHCLFPLNQKQIKFIVIKSKMEDWQHFDVPLNTMIPGHRT